VGFDPQIVSYICLCILEFPSPDSSFAMLLSSKTVIAPCEKRGGVRVWTDSTVQMGTVRTARTKGQMSLMYCLFDFGLIFRPRGWTRLGG
jgi:hypothetical protein